METSNEEKARKLLADAERKAALTGGSVGLSRIFGAVFGAERLEQTSDLYVKAANLFKLAKNWLEAGNCFYKSARLHTGDQKFNGALNYCEAANCYRKIDHQKSIDCYLKAIHIYEDMGKFLMAAKYYEKVAEIYEEPQLMNLEKVMQYFEKASDYYSGESNSKHSADRCLIKIAHIAAEFEQYQRAIEIYERVASTSINNQLLKYGAKDYFFRAALCHLCVDRLNCELAIRKYEQLHPPFSDCRECRLIKELLLAFEDNDVDRYTESVRQYDSISRLDKWYTQMLLRVKKHIVDDEIDLK